MKKGIILIVDDAETNRVLLEAILEPEYHIVHAEGGEEALELVFSRKVVPDLILLDILMPHISGFQVLSILKTEPETAGIPVMFITAADNDKLELESLNAGAADYIVKPFVPGVVKVRVGNYMELLNYRKDLEAMVNNKVRELVAAKEHMIETMASIIEYRNLESGQHVRRATELAKIFIAQLLEHPKFRKELLDSSENILKAAPLHDIGKIAIPDSILLKPDKLTPEEFEIIKTHPTVGAAIIKSMTNDSDDPYFKHSYDIVLSHHENWDGSGYPEGKSGEDIPLSARIMAIVDVYDALTSKRVYKRAATHEEAVEIMREASGSRFDPQLTDVFLEVQDKIKDCASRFA